MSNIEFPFFAFPQAFMYSENLRQLPPYAKLLYVLLLDRAGLSEENTDIFSDENGVFIYFSEEEACRLLGCSRPTVSAGLKSLEEKGLIRTFHQGRNLPNKIRVLPCKEFVKKHECENHQTDVKNSDNRTLKNFTSGSKKIAHPDVKNFDTNHTYNIHTYNNQTYPLQGEEEDITGKIKENVEYEIIACGEEKEILDELIMIMTDMYSCRNREMRIGGNTYSADYVRKRILQIDSDSIMDVYYRIRNNRTKVKDHTAYIKQLLFNAPATQSSAAVLDYGHDFNS